MKFFPYYKQLDAMDCDSTSLRMIAKYYGKTYSAQTLRQRSHISREGVSLLGISDAAESIGFHTMGVKSTWDKDFFHNNNPIAILIIPKILFRHTELLIETVC
jgi:ATP-binding cassette subfamily B protein